MRTLVKSQNLNYGDAQDTYMLLGYFIYCTSMDPIVINPHLFCLWYKDTMS